MIKLTNPLNAILSRQAMLEQHIAVFGESGSGKTTLLSTFFGWHDEYSFSKTNGYSLKAVDTS